MITIPAMVQFFSLSADIATTLGLPALVFTLLIERSRVGRARDREAQLELSRRYSDFLQLTIDKPELWLSDTLTAKYIKVSLGSEALNQQRLAAFQIVISILEDAHFLFHDEDTPLKREAWSGWAEYMRYWMSRKDFASAWKGQVGDGFNKDFTKFMNSIPTSNSSTRHVNAPKPNAMPRPSPPGCDARRGGKRP